jgi:hypothetical protein
MTSRKTTGVVPYYMKLCKFDYATGKLIVKGQLTTPDTPTAAEIKRFLVPLVEEILDSDEVRPPIVLSRRRAVEPDEGFGDGR